MPQQADQPASLRPRRERDDAVLRRLFGQFIDQGRGSLQPQRTDAARQGVHRDQPPGQKGQRQPAHRREIDMRGHQRAQHGQQRDADLDPGNEGQRQDQRIEHAGQQHPALHVLHVLGEDLHFPFAQQASERQVHPDQQDQEHGQPQHRPRKRGRCAHAGSTQSPGGPAMGLDAGIVVSLRCACRDVRAIIPCRARHARADVTPKVSPRGSLSRARRRASRWPSRS